MNESVAVDRVCNGEVARVAFSGDKGNVLTMALLEKLDATLADLAGDRHLKLVILEGAGKHFSVGASIEEHDRDHAAAMLSRFHGFVRRLATFPAPTAAVVRGKCLGGAFELALACNFVIAARAAAFACPEITLGVFPPVLAALGSLRLGAAWAERLTLTGEEIDAEVARALGFVTEVVPDGTDALEHAIAWYEKKLARKSAFALRQALAAVRIGSGVDDRVTTTLARIEKRYVDHVVPSFDGNEGIAAFLTKRDPRWRNE